MSTVLRFLLTANALLTTGCASPMTELVATHQDGAIDQQLFKKGDEVWVTYRDKYARMQTKRGRVLSTDGDSVTLDIGRRGPIDIEYRSIQTISRPAKDRSYVSLSAGTFLALEGHGQELPSDKRLAGLGVSFRHASYLNGDIEGTLLTGGKRAGFSSWIGITVNGHFYTIIPRTYFLLGLGYVSAKSIGEYSGPYGRLYYNPRKSLYIFRIGFGVTNPISKRLNVRVEADLLGLRIYFERRIH